MRYVMFAIVALSVAFSVGIASAEERTIETADGPKILKFKVGGDGKEMVWIPGGTFEMGDRWGDGAPDERPAHTVKIDGFWMDTTEVTNDEFQRFVESSGHKVEGSWKYDPKRANYPAQFVSWNDASAYAEWAGKRLPTEAEWEYAAGGPNHRRWSLGDTFDPTKYNIPKEGERFELKPVASYPPNGFGLYDMSGNAWEWCADWYDAGYYAKSPKDNPRGPESGEYKVLRGGTDPHQFGEKKLRVSLRFWFSPDGTFDMLGLGFRCASDE
ncbi:MAG: formylglycine-generating enzyme family protein [bacterium]